MSTLYHCSYSRTENPSKQVLFVHGWGMNSGIWNDILPVLVSQLPEYQFTVVDLPGHGRSSPLKPGLTSASLADALQPLLSVKQSNIIVGWSMGALVAIDLAAIFRDDIHQLVLVGATPRFVQNDDWPDAVEAKLFQSFANSLQKDHRATLKRFLAIQALGSPSAKQDIKKIQSQLSLQGEADPVALQQGLQILLNEDKRELLASLTIPVTFIAGQRDTLVKLRALKQLAQSSNISLQTIAQAGHAPFISHPQAFVEILLKTV